MTRSLPCLFMRGGTSKALMFRTTDLPADKSLWDAIFIAAMGSPDPYGRQLNGMGGGVSSLSKVCVVGPSSRDDADVDYTFAQVMVDEARVDYSINCGNMSSAVGPFAVLRGMVGPRQGDNAVRIFNTNTRKVIVATFGVQDGVPLERGELEIPGVSGRGAPIRLDFLDPGGATTGKLLPAGAIAQALEVPGIGRLEVTMIDAANACVFVDAASVGMRGNEMPSAIGADTALMERLGAVRACASVAMGITPDLEEARRRKASPFIAVVSPPQDADSLDGQPVRADAADLTVRALSSGQPHSALPLTISLCTAVAARLPGSIVQRAARAAAAGQDTIRLAMPSGVLTVGAEVAGSPDAWQAKRGSFYRTARRLFEGQVYY